LDWPAGAVWNFPAGRRGQLRMRVHLRPQFAGAVIGLTDHFSVPFDQEDVFHNIYNFEIGRNGILADGMRLEPGRWQDLLFAFDANTHQCRVSNGGTLVATLKMRRESAGPSYLRIRSTAEQDTAGLSIDAVSCDVSASWA
jgi:hypothetical protein